MRILLVLILVLAFFSCVRNKNLQNPPVQSQTQPEIPGTSKSKHVVEVKEVVQGSSYTYLRVSENGKEDWIAIGKQESAVGDIYYYENALRMTDFKSKELDRTFDVIYFVSQLSNDPKLMTGKNSTAAHSGKVQSGQRDNINIKKAEGEITIAELFKNRSKYAGKKVKITGVVVKINNSIMDRNWIHIQDGTSDSGNFDLTITSHDEVNVDDKATFEGTITLNKDFGAGYLYDVVMEGATLVPAAI